MIKYIGLLMIAAAAVFLSREYEKKEKKRLSELSEFIRLLEHVKTKISCFLSPKSDWLSNFSSKEETISEFLLLSRNHTLKESFAAVMDKLSLGSEIEILKRLFESFGRGYKDGEIELIDAALRSLVSERETISSECEKNVKTVKVLLTALSLGLIILLI